MYLFVFVFFFLQKKVTEKIERLILNRHLTEMSKKRKEKKNVNK